MDLSDLEQRVLAAVWSCLVRGEVPGQQTLDEEYRSLSEFSGLFRFAARPQDWAEATSGLVERGLLVHQDGAYSLAEGAQPCARRVARELDGRTNSNVLLTAERSRAFGAFCERVYGRNLCQIGLASVADLERLVSVLDLGAHSHVLDVGCGIGLIAEYIASLTGATVTGIDLARGAIARAHERTAAERDRLTFLVGDMDDLPFPARSFDTVVCVDTLHFAADQLRTLVRLRDSLRPGGQMGILHTQFVEPGESKARLRPGGTSVAEALKPAGLRYQYWDLTGGQPGFWQRWIEAAEALKPAFEAEGNGELCRAQAGVGQYAAEHLADGRIARYLYHVRIT